LAAALVEESCLLKWLSLSYNSITSTGAEALGDALARNAHLLELRLGSNEICGEGARALGSALQTNTTLIGLFIRRNKLGEQGANFLRQALARISTLQKLGLQSNEFGDAGASLLAQGLRENRSVIELELDQNQIGNTGAKDVAEAVARNPGFKILCLGRNQIEDGGAEAIAEKLAGHRGLHEIHLQKNWMEWGGIMLAEKLPQNGMLRELHLQGNHIYIQGAEGLSSAVQGGGSLHTLDISACYIGSQGAYTIAEMIRNPNQGMKILRMGSNEFQDYGAECIAWALEGNKTLEEVRLDYNFITNKGAQALADALPKTRLQCVDLNSNLIEDAGATAISVAVVNMRYLGELGLKENPITPPAEAELKKASWTNADKFKKSPPKVKLGCLDVIGAEDVNDALEIAPAPSGFTFLRDALTA